MTESIEFTSIPDNNRVGTQPISARLETDDVSGSSSVDVSIDLLVDGSVVSTKSASDDDGTTFTVEFEYNFTSSDEYSLTVSASYEYDGGLSGNVSDSADIFIRPLRDTDVAIGGQEVTDYRSAFRGRSDTIIENITTDDDVNLSFDQIDFAPYGNPSVAVDTAGRFAKHDIIGGTTVRQKLGEEPRAVEVSGVCTESVAKQVNQLHQAKLCSLNSETVGEIIRCQIGSTSTDPLVDGGAADMDGAEFLYTYNINLIEVTV